MKDGLYHKDLYWFTEFEQITKNNINTYKTNVNYTSHYKSQISSRYVPRIPSVYELLYGELIEVEVKDGNVIKSLIRTKFDNEHDIITVIKFVDGIILYITGWVNNINDYHNNMDTKKYILREEEKICV